MQPPNLGTGQEPIAMKHAVALLLVLASLPAGAATPPSGLTANGRWEGKGIQVGEPFTACATIAPHMDDTLVHVTLDLRFDDAGHAPLRSEAFLTMRDGGVVDGVSFDNRTNAFQVTGRYNRDGMQTEWSRHGSVIGKSAWRLSEDGQRLTLQTFGLMPDGRVLEIGAVEFSRIAAAAPCHAR
jgi:hypothetical protein